MTSLSAGKVNHDGVGLKLNRRENRRLNTNIVNGQSCVNQVRDVPSPAKCWNLGTRGPSRQRLFDPLGLLTTYSGVLR